MNRNQILKIYGADYKEITKQLLERADLAGHIEAKAAEVGAEQGGSYLRIGIKPNLVVPSPAEFGATTHPEVVAGIIEYLQERHFLNIVIAEGSWVGDRTEDAFLYCGYRELEETYGVPLVDTQRAKWHEADAAGMKLQVTDTARDIDFLINVPVLKGHCQTKMTCALKNLKGLIPNAEKRHFHTMGLHRPIAHLQTAIRQDFIVVDHICGDLDFEEGGNPVVRNCVMTVVDPVLADAYACSLLGLKPEDVPYVMYAETLGVGSTNLEDAEILAVGGESAEEDAPRHRRVLDVAYAVDAVDSCSACYGSLIGALSQLKEEGLLERLDVPIGIGQGMQGRTGALGVGRCTAGFEVSIPGCPPDEDAMVRGLRAYIKEHQEENGDANLG